MKTTHHRSRRALFALLAGMLTLVLATLATAPAGSATTGTITYYFNDAAHDQQVGSRTTCPHFSILTGKATIYFSTRTINCP
jgi:hypothetical protein